MKSHLSKDESGYTLLEALLSLLLSSFILLFLSSVILQLNKLNELIIEDAQVISSSKNMIKGSRQIEWHLFLNQMEAYLENTQLISFTHHSIVVEEDQENNNPITVKYGRAQTGYKNFNRSKNNGYNALLTDIEKIYLDVDDQWLIMTFLFKNQEEYTGRIWIESWNKKEDIEAASQNSSQKTDI